MMACVQYYNRVIPCQEGQTVLDALLENGQDIPHSCKMSVCVTCIMKVVEGDVPAQAQAGLRDSLASQGYFLPCVCQPTADMRVVDMDREDLFSPAVVHDIEYLSPDICRIFLEPATPLYYRAGQFMNIRREDGLTRSYSLASVPSLDNRLEYHVTLKERWLRYDMGTKAAIVKTSIDECEGRYKNEKPIIVPKPA